MRALFLGLALLAPATAADWIWVEGEAAQAEGWNGHSWLARDVDRSRLSGGAWLCHLAEAGSGGANPVARWRLVLPGPGRWVPWVRQFYRGSAGPWRYRLGGGPWRLSAPGPAFIDPVPLGPHRAACWSVYPAEELAAGEVLLEAECLPRPDGSRLTAIDAILLVPEGMAFTPRGALKPGETSAVAVPAGFTAFAPPEDPPPETQTDLDLRVLLPPAGPGLAAAGERLRDGQGRETRLFGVNVGPRVVGLEAPVRRRLAAFLARRGVNAVRIHGLVADRQGPDPKAVDGELAGRVAAFAAELWEEGIATHLSTYFPLWVRVAERDGIPGFDPSGSPHPFGLVFFEPRFQELHRAWLAGLLGTAPSPGAPPLGKAPGLALVEAVNEDGLLFHTLKNVRGGPRRLLEGLFAAWLGERHGGEEGAARAWGTRLRSDERLGPGGRVALLDPWSLTAAGLARAGRDAGRARDQAAFLGGLQRRFYAGIGAFLRQEAGYAGLVVGSNWKGADPLTHAIDLWSNAALDAVDRHGYFEAETRGAKGWTLNPGLEFASRAAVRHPGHHLFGGVAWAGKPALLTEAGFVPPNRLRADGPVALVCSALVRGLDGIFWFAVSGPGWEPGLDAYSVLTPAQAGIWPALALIYRRGDLAEAPPARLEAGAAELLGLRWPFGWGAEGVDLARGLAAGGAPAAAAGSGAWLLCPAVMSLGDPPRPDLAPLARLAGEGPRLEAATGEVVLHRDRGVLAFAAPRAAGWAGSLEPEEMRHGAFAVRPAFGYGAVLLVSLDGEPLDRSRRVLLGLATEERNGGERTTDLGGGWLRLDEPGTGPVLYRSPGGTVRLRGGPWQARPFDPALRLGAPLPLAPADGELEFALDGRSFLYEIRRP